MSLSLSLVCMACRMASSEQLDVRMWNVASQSQREECPYWNAIGALDDHLELMCEGPQINANAAHRAFRPLTPESLALACCPKPYQACKKADRVAGCDAIIASHVGVDSRSLTVLDAYARVQSARGALRNGHAKCHVLAPEQPQAKCSEHSIGAAFDRPDIYCEMLLWQAEQMGDGDQEEFRNNRCPWPGGTLVKSQVRHAGHILAHELPDWANALARGSASFFREHD